MRTSCLASWQSPSASIQWRQASRSYGGRSDGTGPTRTSSRVGGPSDAGVVACVADGVPLSLAGVAVTVPVTGEARVGVAVAGEDAPGAVAGVPLGVADGGAATDASAGVADVAVSAVDSPGLTGTASVQATMTTASAVAATSGTDTRGRPLLRREARRAGTVDDKLPTLRSTDANADHAPLGSRSMRSLSPKRPGSAATLDRCWGRDSLGSRLLAQCRSIVQERRLLCQ